MILNQETKPYNLIDHLKEEKKKGLIDFKGMGICQGLFYA